MRDAFHDKLDEVSERLVAMTHLAGSAISRSTTALLDADLELAESVIVGDLELDRLRQELDTAAVALLAREAPVATDLRTVVTALRMSSDLERMGDLARHVAKVARLRHPDSAVPPGLRAAIVQMGQVAERIVAKAGSVIATHDVDLALALEHDDDAMDELHREMFRAIVQADLPTETVVDLTLLGRYYERFADHAVSVARRVIYLVTGGYHTEGSVDHDSHEDAAAARAIREVLDPRRP